MQQVNSLIRTKLRQPFIRPGLISRSRLQLRVMEGLQGPLTLVIAPAGFGKTTLMAASLAGCSMQKAWLSLDRNDNQAGSFLTYLIAALQVVDKEIGSEAAQLITGMQQALPEAVMTSLINDLDAASGNMALVLDDYQFISAPEVHAAVAFLLDHCPPSFHLLIATRSDPPLPLARLRAHGQLVELRTADLRLTPAEAGQFLADVMGLHLDTEAVAALEERTEGWIAGLQMAALSMRERKDVQGFIEGFSGTNRYILDYLLEEVLAQQPPETQRFLLSTSILERLTAPLCDALLAAPDSRKPGGGEDMLPLELSSDRQLEYLERENLFLVSLDEKAVSGSGAHWFRYHHLFADLLKARLQQTHPELVPQLHIRASVWLEQQGFITEAIQHLFAAGEIDRAADLIERYGPVRWSQSDLSVMQMAERLPYEMLTARSKIGIYQAWLLINQGHIEKALPLLMNMARQFAGANINPGQRWIETIIRLALAFLNPRSSMPGLDLLPETQLLDEIPASEQIMRDAANILYGMTLGRRGEFDRAAEFSVTCIQKQQATDRTASPGKPSIPILVPFLATIYLFQGRLHAAAALCHEFLGPIKQKGIRVSTAGNMDVVLGNVLYERHCLEEAEKQIRDGLQANEPWGNIMTDAFGMLALTHVLRAKGDFAGAMQMVEKFEKRLQEPSRPIEFSEDFRTLRVRMQLASGDLQIASDWADQIQHSEDFHQHPEYYRLTLARICLAQGKFADVEEMLTVKSSINLSGNRISRQIQSTLLLATAAAAQQQWPHALRLIESCLALAEPEGYIQNFLDMGEPARELLAAYLRLEAAGQKRYAQKVLNAFSSSNEAGSSGSQPAGLVEPLSRRELEVLQLMAAGRTNEEIACKLILATGTIKAHAASIYRKLDVANRTEAVARARQLGMLL